MSRDRKKEQKEGQGKLKTENNAKATENKVWTKDERETAQMLRQILGQVGFRADGDVGVGQRL